MIPTKSSMRCDREGTGGHRRHGSSVTLEGMPIGLFENELTVQLWQPATIRGYTFNVGDNVTLDQTKIEKTPPVGGDFAWLFATYQAERTGNPFESFWNRLPPPLLREGTKVQTPWLTGFLKDPHMIRPAAQLRMPRFHYGKSDQVPSRETAELANYFAARDRTEFPYQTIPEQNSSYLAERNKAHADYLGAGWQMMTNKASPCLQCHAHRPVQAERWRPGRQRSRPARGRTPVPPRLSHRAGSPTRAGSFLLRRCPRTSHPMERSRSWCPRRSRINRLRWSRRFETRS